jgi:release factor glutamine methyltransferase
MRVLKEVFDEGCKYLIEKNIEDAKLDAWYLLSNYFDISRAEYFLTLEKEVSESDYFQYMKLIKRRGRNIPLQYITGVQEFMGLSFKVNNHVLIPRQDTEVLVEEVLKVSAGKDVLDLCTGSGCIIISLAKLGNIKKGVGIDISKEALETARENKKANNVEVEFIESDMFGEVEGKFDIIVSNPPYIPSSEISKLMVEVKMYEPCIALDGMDDGLYFYRLIIKEIRNYLKPNGYIFFEIGFDQADDVMELLRNEGITNLQVKKDLAGLDRVICGRYK